jgi:hypothetical protein
LTKSSYSSKISKHSTNLQYSRTISIFFNIFSIISKKKLTKSSYFSHILPKFFQNLKILQNFHKSLDILLKSSFISTLYILQKSSNILQNLNILEKSSYSSKSQKKKLNIFQKSSNSSYILHILQKLSYSDKLFFRPFSEYKSTMLIGIYSYSINDN